jgi:hypothetical protein
VDVDTNLLQQRSKTPILPDAVKPPVDAEPG